MQSCTLPLRLAVSRHLTPDHLMDDTDLAGPLVFVIVLGIFLLMSGKAHFGYIYAFGGLGCVSLYL